MHSSAVLLHNIRSAHNVGSIFRTCDAAGVSHVYLTGYTPCPVDRFGRPQRDIAKTALGAERTVPWTHVRAPRALLQSLRERGYEVVGIEQCARSEHYASFRPSGPTVFLFGNEVRGISPRVLAQCDRVLEIPMRGAKESLNVSVAAGIALFSALAANT